MTGFFILNIIVIAKTLGLNKSVSNFKRNNFGKKKDLQNLEAILKRPNFCGYISKSPGIVSKIEHSGSPLESPMCFDQALHLILKNRCSSIWNHTILYKIMLNA